jgi:hypothetical protein
VKSERLFIARRFDMYIFNVLKISLTLEKDSFDLSIFYCKIYTIGLNTSFTTYMKFSPVLYNHTNIGLTESMTDKKKCTDSFRICNLWTHYPYSELTIPRNAE